MKLSEEGKAKARPSETREKNAPQGAETDKRVRPVNKTGNG